jgi:predicted negative regulator of RcsB-dependent stress response
MAKKRNSRKSINLLDKLIQLIHDNISLLGYDGEKFDSRNLLGIAAGFVFLLGGFLGYGLGQADQVKQAEASATQMIQMQAPARVLGQQATREYVNPFEYKNLKRVSFPINQLKNCRDYQECHNFCAQPANYSTCTAWIHSQK